MPPALRTSIAVAALVVGATACGSDDGVSDDALDATAARSELARICTETADGVVALPTDPAQLSQTDYSTEVARLLENEAAAVDRLIVLDAGLRTDLRTFVTNTRDQADGWRRLADAVDSNTLGDLPDVTELTTEITELSLGRDDLADEMGVAACRRAS